MWCVIRGRGSSTVYFSASSIYSWPPPKWRMKEKRETLTAAIKRKSESEFFSFYYYFIFSVDFTITLESIRDDDGRPRGNNSVTVIWRYTLHVMYINKYINKINLQESRIKNDAYSSPLWMPFFYYYTVTPLNIGHSRSLKCCPPPYLDFRGFRL